MGEVGRATLHLKVLGESCKVGVGVPGTPAGVGDLLPAARAITNATMEVAMAKSGREGFAVSCRKGCSACCYQLVGITVPEARALAKLVEEMPAERQATIRRRFAKTLELVRKKGVLDPKSSDGEAVLLLHRKASDREAYLDMAGRYFKLHRACPFLEDGACSIYEDRPLICREYAVTSPAEHCERLEYAAINMVGPPVRLSDGLAEVTAVVEGKAVEQIPLFAALAWAAIPGNAMPEANVSGVELLKLLARWVDRQSGVPLEERGGGSQ